MDPWAHYHPYAISLGHSPSSAGDVQAPLGLKTRRPRGSIAAQHLARSPSPVLPLVPSSASSIQSSPPSSPWRTFDGLCYDSCDSRTPESNNDDECYNLAAGAQLYDWMSAEAYEFSDSDSDEWLVDVDPCKNIEEEKQYEQAQPVSQLQQLQQLALLQAAAYMSLQQEQQVDAALHATTAGAHLASSAASSSSFSASSRDLMHESSGRFSDFVGLKPNAHTVSLSGAAPLGALRNNDHAAQTHGLCESPSPSHRHSHTPSSFARPSSCREFLTQPAHQHVPGEAGAHHTRASTHMQLIATHDKRTPLLLADGSVYFAEYKSDASAANAQEQNTERALPAIRTLHNVSAAIPATSITAPYAFAATSAASAATAPTMQKVQAPLVSGAPEHHLQKDRIAEQMRHLGCSSTLASGSALARGDADGPLFPQGIAQSQFLDPLMLQRWIQLASLCHRTLETASAFTVSPLDLEEDLAMEAAGHAFLGIQVKITARKRLRDLHKCLYALNAEGIVDLYRAEEPFSNCILGFAGVQVNNCPLFNMHIREMVLQDKASCWLVNGKKELLKPTGPVYELLRQIGIKPVRGMRGPLESDPGKRDFMYYFRYEFDAELKSRNCHRLQTGYIGKAHAKEPAQGPKTRAATSEILPAVSLPLSPSEENPFDEPF
mmetsp:Transcript_103117/g.166232  ORF Transcript_103117/g.166232 Transcript_103117/m.166232 type:complete len:662 (+) Transcript_103117:196-2181(+)